MPGKAYKPWPADCVWPRPQLADSGSYWEAEYADSLPVDSDAEDLLEIKDYFDDLVSEGRLNPDYTLNEDFDDYDSSWEPDKGLDYWDDGFDANMWEEDLESHLNLLKLALPSPVSDIQHIIGYEFINENLLRQAFTRRAFGIEYGAGDSENLELIGDSVLNTCVTREICRHLAEVNCDNTSGPFVSSYSEGDLSRIRQHYVCKEFLSSRASELGLDKYILYGTVESASDSSREDMIEALIGAVSVDCSWDWNTIESAVDKLLCIQLSEPSALLGITCYDAFNSWHQKKFGIMPEYEVSKGCSDGDGSGNLIYSCTLRYRIPDNDKGIHLYQRVDVKADTRSRARDLAAREAYAFVVGQGLWMNLNDANLSPVLDNSINQLQELYQKKYVSKPEYTFTEDDLGWYCECVVDCINGCGRAANKTAAKKKASFVALVRLLKSAGIATKELEQEMWKVIAGE